MKLLHSKLRMRFGWVLVVALGASCRSDERESTTIPGSDPLLNSDAGFLDIGGAGVDNPTRSACIRGTVNCLAENSPLFERCDGSQFIRGSCDESQVCQERKCVPFGCDPGRAICVGEATQATCDPTGKGFIGATACFDDTVCRGGVCIDLCEQAANDRSYIGCEYVATHLDTLAGDEPLGVVVSNPAKIGGAKISLFGESGAPIDAIETITLTPDPQYLFSAPITIRSEFLGAVRRSITNPISAVEVPPSTTAIVLIPADEKSVRIVSSRPTVAYQFSPYCCNFTATNDASLLLPKSTWGTRYRAVGYPSFFTPGFSAAPYLQVFADEPTRVTVKGSVTLQGSDNQAGTELVREVTRAGAKFQVVLDPMGEQDLSGVTITADKPIAVFSGHPCTFVPQDKWACDHLQEQLPPAETLGTDYFLVPTRRRALDDTNVDEATYYRIVADADATVLLTTAGERSVELLPSSTIYTPTCVASVSVDGTSFDLAEGETCEVGVRVPLTVTASAPVIIAGVLSGHQSTGVRQYGTQAGDPSMFILPPVGQFRRSYVFSAPPSYRRSYVAVMIAESSGLLLDGGEVEASQRLERQRLDLNGQKWESFHIAISDGFHTLEAETSFGIVAYAYDDYVSYAFTGGLDLKPKGQ